jgi:hypothetical protein
VKKRILGLAAVTALLLCAVPVAGCHSVGVGAGSGERRAVEVVVVFHGAPLEVVKQFRVGDTLKVKDTGSVIGQISAVTTTDTIQPTPDASGLLVAAVVPGQIDVLLTVKATPTVTPDSYRFSGERVYVNQDIKFVTPLVSFTGTVLSIRETGQ